MKDYLLIALGTLRKRFLRTTLTALGIIIGIAAVVALISLGQGMQDAINSQFASVGADKVIIQGAQAGFGPPGQDVAGKITEDDLRVVRRVPGVKRAAGRLLRSVTVEYKDVANVVFAASLPQGNDERDLVLEALNVEVEHGRILKASDTKKAVVGYDYWATELYPKPVELGKKLLINGQAFEVTGLMPKIGAGRDDAIILNHDDMEELLQTDEELSAIFAQVEGAEPAQVAERVKRVLRKDRHQKEGFEDFTVETSEELINSINTILGVVTWVFVGIALISLLVGGIGIMNTMYTSVLERTREIGVMKAIGATNNSIMLIFLLESGVLGLVGGGIGVLMGVGLSKLVELAAQGAIGSLLQASFPMYLIVGALTFSFLIGCISGIFPARQASKLPPVEALRK